jgi:replicative DNA helicase
MDPVWREPPNSPEVEQAVLSQILFAGQAPDVAKARAEMPHPLFFFRRTHQQVYAICLELDDLGERVDADTVIERLRLTSLQDLGEVLNACARREKSQLVPWERSRRQLQPQADDTSAFTQIGGYDFFNALSAVNPQGPLFSRNVAKLSDYYRKRCLVTLYQESTDRLWSPESSDVVIDQSCTGMLAISRFGTTVQAHTLTSVAEEVRADQAERATGMGTITVGYPDVDQHLRSLRPGGLYILAARPGVGKTSFALDIAERAFAPGDDRRVLFASLEVDRRDLFRKLLGKELRIPFADVESASVEQFDDWMRTFNLERRFEILDLGDLSVAALRSHTKRMLANNQPISLVVVDYLQLMAGSRGDMNEYERVSEISRQLKILAKEARVPILALSQMSRDAEKGATKGPREPRLSDLRGSGSIEQDADAVVFLHNATPETDRASTIRRIKVIVAKNRFGSIGDAWFDFNCRVMAFEPAHGEAEEVEAPPRGTGAVLMRRERDRERREPVGVSDGGYEPPF